MTEVPTTTQAGPLSLGLALSPRPWRSALHRHCRDHESEVAVRLLTDGNQLLETDAPKPDVVLVDDATSWLDSSIVGRLAGRDIAVLAVHDPIGGDDPGRRHLLRAGVAAIVPAAPGAESLLDAARALRPDPDTRSSFDHLIANTFERPPSPAAPLWVVGGPAGVGVTEISIALACEVTSASRVPARPVLVETATVRPRLARRLGLAFHPDLLTACDLVEHRERPSDLWPADVPPAGRGSLDDAGPSDDFRAAFAVAALPNARTTPFDAIVAPAARQAGQVRGAEVEAVVERLRAGGRAPIVRIASTAAAGRGEGPTLDHGIVTGADHVVAVAEGSPMGLLDLVDWLSDLGPIDDRASMTVVLNRAPDQAGVRARLEREARRLFGGRAGRIAVVGHDTHVERAVWDATVAGRGPLRDAMHQVAQTRPTSTPTRR